MSITSALETSMNAVSPGSIMGYATRPRCRGSVDSVCHMDPDARAWNAQTLSPNSLLTPGRTHGSMRLALASLALALAFALALPSASAQAPQPSGVVDAVCSV